MFKLTLLTPDKKIFVDQEIEDVLVPAFRGELNVLPGHAPLITTLSTGILRWKAKGDSNHKSVVVSWGYCEIHPDGVDILADIVDLPEEISLDSDKASLQENEQKLLNEYLDDEQWDDAHRAIARARAHQELVKN